MNLSLRFRVVPRPGYVLLKAGPGEYLVHQGGDTTRNAMLDRSVVMTAVRDRIYQLDPTGFYHGLGTLWDIEPIDD